MKTLQPSTASALLSALVTRAQVERLQLEVSKLPQYEPVTKHYFHGGMYCRDVWRDAGVLVVGKVHLKEHFYLVVEGTLLITTDDGAQEVKAPALLECKPGTKRAVYSVTAARCMTFHRTNAKTVEQAEAELVEADSTSMYTADNKVKQEVLS